MKQRQWKRSSIKVIVAALIGALLPLGIAAQAQAAQCFYNANGTIEFNCAYTPNRMTYDSRIHIFLVRAGDNQVFSAWEVNAGGGGPFSAWSALGGVAHSAVGTQTGSTGGTLWLRLRVIGSDNTTPYCKWYNQPPHNGVWYPGTLTWTSAC